MGREKRTIETDFLGIEVIGKKKKINSKVKGNANELECAKFLHKWTGVKFSRVPSSGGLRWQDTVNACGDLICQDQDFLFDFAVETKHLKSLTFSRNLRENSSIFRIHLQAVRDAERARKCPMMCLRKNGMEAQRYVVYVPFKIEGLSIYSEGTTLVNKTPTELYGYLSDYLMRKSNFDDINKLASKWCLENYSK